MQEKSKHTFQFGGKIYNISKIFGDVYFNINENNMNFDKLSQELGFKFKKEQLKSIFKLNNSETELAVRLPLILAHKYYFSTEFNSIKIHADIDNSFGSLSMDEYFIHPSYIPEKDLLKRETIVQNENETSAIKVKKSGQFQHFLPHDYISGNLFENSDRVVITGSPGVGKSTYARWLCYMWAKTKINIKAVFIYINLRDLRFDTSNPIADYIKNEYFKESILNEVSLIKILSLLNKNFCFILDGFDELESQNQKKLKQNLYRLSSKSRYILLSRPYGLLQTYGLNWETAFQIDGFNHSNIHNYIDKFLAVNPQENKSKNNLTEIIQNNPVLYDYAHNPLMLSFIVYIYLKSNNPNENLSKIQSQYDLQNEVFRWINKYEKNKDTYIFDKKMLEASEQFAYSLQIKKQHNYISLEEPDKYEAVTIFLSRIGIGNTQNLHTGNTKFNFNTITFREFLSARYLRSIINENAFLYLSEEKYFWNFSRMLIGAIASDKKYEQINKILSAFAEKFQTTRKIYYRYFYYTFLSEINSDFINKNIGEQQITELYYFFKTSYFDKKWIYLFSEAVVRIYSKLKYKNKNIFRNLIINDISQFVETEAKTSDDVNLDDSIIHVINQLHLYHDTEFICKMIDYYKKFVANVESYDFFDKYYGLALCFLEWFSEISTETITIFEDDLKKIVEITPVFFIEERTKVALLVQKINTVFADLLSAEKELSEAKEDNIFAVLQKLTSSIFLVGHLYKPNCGVDKQTLSDKLVTLSEKIAEELEDEFKYEDFDYNSLVNLTVYGLVAFNEPQLYDSILSLIVATEPAYVFIRIPDNKSFLLYLKQLISQSTDNFSETVFAKLLFAIRDTENARNYFALFRDDFFNMMNSYVQKNITAFNNVEGLYTQSTIEDDELYLEYAQKTLRFNRITELMQGDGEIFSYDKKFLLDKMLENKYDKILFFRRYLIPRLLADDFNFFQPNYWKMLLTYSDNFRDLTTLLHILENEGAYTYEANLPYLFLVYTKIVKNINQFSEEKLSDYSQFIIKITANLLLLLKKTENSEYIEKILPFTGILLNNPHIKASFKDTKSIQSFEGEHLTPYILQYYFTNSNEFDLQIDYDKHTEDFKRERMSLLHTLINLFTKNDKLDLAELMTLKTVLGKSFTKRIHKYLEFNFELLKKFSEKEFEILIQEN